MPEPTSRHDRLDALLRAKFMPDQLVVDNDSARHAGHAGAEPTGETHFNVTIVSPAFEGVGRVARSRAVHEALAGEFASGLHALSLKLHTPSEAEAKSDA